MSQLTTTIRRFALNLVASVTAAGIFILMLPLTLLAMSFLLISGVLTLVMLRYKLRQGQVHSKVRGSVYESASSSNEADQPIEGSYTIIRK